MTEILMAILMIVIGTTTLIFTGEMMIFIFSLCAGCYFIIDILTEAKQLE